MPITAETFEAVVLEDTDGHWELHRGKLRQKPPMSYGHNESARSLAYQLITRLPRTDFDVLQNGGYLRGPNGEFYLPDLAVVPNALMASFAMNPSRFEKYGDPVPFVAEVWSPRTGTYDVETKFPIYRLRGDFEIWRIHPFQRTLTAWRRQPDGSYEVMTAKGGTVRLHALPEVGIDLDGLFPAV